MSTTGNITQSTPPHYAELMVKSDEAHFDMRSDFITGSLLKTLAATKPGGRILEMGTGTGISLSWLLAGADTHTKVVSIENDPALLEIAQSFFGEDQRVDLICDDGAAWIRNYSGPGFDLIFADAWPGKYELLEETLGLLTTGGIYMIDDMLPQPNWPEGHAEKAQALVDQLVKLDNFHVTQLECSTGLMLLSKKN